MNATAVRLAPVVFLLLLLQALNRIEAAALSPIVPEFIARYCLECHDSETAKGDRNFESFLASPEEANHQASLEEMLEQLNLGEMPPKKKRVDQPSDLALRAVIKELTRYLSAVEVAKRPDSPGMRRLTRYQYNNTIRDLLGVDTVGADQTRLFPPDPRTHGFANLGSIQTLSDHQLGLYLDAGRQYLDLALVFNQEKTEPQEWVFRPLDLNGQKKNPGSVRYRVWAKDGSYLDIAHGQPVENGPTYPRQFAKQGVPVDGVYRVRVKATAIGRDHPYDPEIFPNDLEGPLQLAMWHVPDASYLGKRASEGRVLIGIYDLPDNEPMEIEASVWMPAGSIPFVHWINGPGSSKRPMRLLTERYHPEALRKSQTRVDQLREQGLAVAKDELVQRVYISDVYQGPRIRVYEMSMTGPLHEEWPPAGHRRLFGLETDADRIDIEAALIRFAGLAFRRPVDRESVAHQIDFVQKRKASGVSSEEAIKLALTAMLASPRFLFLDEGRSKVGEALDPWQMASRLSYALWSSMPDAPLRRLADEGGLMEKTTFAGEIDRLIDDPKSAAFIEHFTDAWLNLYKLGSMPPGEKQFPAYYRDRLESAMKTETRLFVADALRNNRPISHLLTSRETFLNGKLAKHYGIEGVSGEAFRRVRYPETIRRAGLLGHASVLTATSNGVETSPVVRGVWVLENILGTPPASAPPDVPPIEPDMRGGTTIREQLAKHRHHTACADCHAKIDPWGFALEFYDPIGAFRTHYPRIGSDGRISSRPGQGVDGSGELPGGEWIRDERDLRAALLKREDQFIRSLVLKILTFATGRELGFRDMEEVGRIVERAKRAGGGFRDLIHHCFESPLFRHR